ncbi:MAG: carboxypeptidase regulatory-like domain-containing protein [Gemmatimonadetes bacterium]|nr:carboxypeptidase regulatory-like domain-containing protein [Gemmatimonadota bacterium]
MRALPRFLARAAALATALATVVFGSAATLHAQPVTDVLRGTVKGDSGRVLAGANVIVTRSTDRAVTQATTDSAGRWRMEIADGSGDYLVFVTASGHQNARRRVQRQAEEREFVVDFTLTPVAPQVLRAVQVQAAAPPRVPRGAPPLGTEETAASEKWIEGVAATLSPAQRGDIGALAGTVAGLTSGPGGSSLLGADASSNLATLNGAAIPGVTLPRAAQTEARFVGGTYDATRGGFAGGQFDLQLSAGDRLFQRRRGFLTLDPSLLQRTDAIGRAQGLDAQSLRASLGADGELVRQTLTYNVALDYTRTASSPVTLLSAGPTTLALAGVNADSARRLATVAPALGLPIGLGDAQQRSERVTWLGRLDDTRDTTRVLALTSLVSVGRDRGLGAQALTTGSALARGSSSAVSLGFMHQRYVGRQRTVYNENRLAYTRSTRDGAAEWVLPQATVLMSGTGTSGDDDLAFVTTGGATNADRAETAWTTEGASEWAWFARGTRHRFRTSAWVRGDGLNTVARPNAFGSYTFNSLADFAANQPASYSRTLGDQARIGSAWNGALAVAHRWAPSRQFQLLYGVRVEGSAFGDAPARNVALEQALGVRTDVAPVRVVPSPRLGFTWRPLPNRPISLGINRSEMGTFIQPSTNIIRGGIGLFRDPYRPGAIANAAANTGLPGATVSIFCVGAAAPTPSWGSYATGGEANIPASCRDGGGALAQQAPGVVALDRGYDAARSWRATLNWSGAVGIWLLRAEAVGARNLGQGSTINANFVNTPRFTLGDDGRPVFVPTTGIDGATGAVSAAASRRSSAFGAVRTVRNDLESQGVQGTLFVTPDLLRSGGRFVTGSYTLQHVRQQYRGFDGGNVGDPSAVEWARGANDARHVFLLQAGTRVPKLGVFTIFWRLQSGRPFTPVVAGDIDGDGTGADRAAIPAAQGAPADFAALLQDAPARIRDCLTRQAGRIAARQSCEGPWTQAMNARLELRVPSRLIGRRTTMSLNASNPLGGLDALLHGDRLRGWGTSAEPDPVLLVPRGFDAATRSYRYRVNPRFGDTRATRTLARTPFRLSLDFSWDLSRSEASQNLSRSMEPVRVNGAWSRPPASAIVQRYLRRISSVHSVILFNTDTLFLTRSQIEAFAKADTVFRAEARGIYTALADSLAALPERFDADAAVEMVRRADRRYEELFWAQRELVKTQLTPIQSSALPEFIRQIVSEPLDPDPARRPFYRFSSDGSSVSVSRSN